MNFKAIIPCAGFGTRMGMKVHESKEMLIDPNTNKPIIDYSLELCKKYRLDPVVITRKEKEELNNYVSSKNLIPIHFEGDGEWMDSVLSSSWLWGEYNILLLPDTRFQPESIIQNIKTSLELGSKTVFGLHKVDDISKWGSVSNYSVIEKSLISKEGYAWGIIGFNKREGNVLFESMKNKVPFILNKSSFSFFDNFKDVTRTGKIEY